MIDLWKAQGAYLNKFVKEWYANDAAVVGDAELQKMVKEMKEKFGGSDGMKYIFVSSHHDRD